MEKSIYKCTKLKIILHESDYKQKALFRVIFCFLYKNMSVLHIKIIASCNHSAV